MIRKMKVASPAFGGVFKTITTKENKIMRKLIPLFAILVMALLTTSVLASTASADSVPIPGTMTATSSSVMTGLAEKQVTLNGSSSWIGIAEKIKTSRSKSSKNCRWFKSFYNSNYLLGTKSKPRYYKDSNGYLCKEPRSPSGWVKRGGGHTGLDCKNIAYPKKPKKKKIHKRPAAEFMSAAAVTIQVQVTVYAQASVKLWCGEAGGQGSATDTVTVSYASFMSARSSEAKLKLYLSIAIKASDVATGAARVECNYTPPPGCQVDCQPPPCQVDCSPVPPDLTITQINDVEVGQSRPYTVDYVVPSGHSATLKFDPHYGAFTSSGTGAVTFTVSGSGSKTATYTAPGEVPAGGTDTITVILTDTTTGKSVTKTTDPFTIKPAATHPL